MATIESIQASGGDYTTPQAWYDAHSGDITNDANAPYIGEMAAESFTGLNMAVSTTSSTKYFHLRAQAGAKFNGNFAGSYPLLNISPSSGAGIITCGDSYTRFEHFVVGSTGPLPNLTHGIALSNCTGIVADTMGVFEIDVTRDSTNALLHGFSLNNSSAVLHNCAIANLTLTNVKDGELARCVGAACLSGSTLSVFNCAVHGLASGAAGTGTATTVGVEVSNGILEAINNVIGTLTGDLTIGVNPINPISSDVQFNATTDTSGGTNSQDNIVPVHEFKDITPATLDLHMKKWSQCEGNGFNLIAGSYSNAPTEDCDDDIRPNPGTWSIGIDHHVQVSTSISVFNRKLIRMVEQNLYTLKRLYGGRIVLCSILDANTNYTTGTKVMPYSIRHIDRAIVLPSQVLRDVVASVARISSNKPLAYGGEFNVGDRGFIIQGKDIGGITVRKDDWIVYRGERYSPKKILNVCGNTGWMIVARRIPGTTLMFHVTAHNAMLLSGEASHE
jgi:hypothetical protein